MAYAQSTAVIATPIGPVQITAEDEALCSITVTDQDAALREPDTPVLARATEQLRAYFAGRLERFDLPLAPAATSRGAALREAIAGIGYGETLSYGGLARIAGSSPRAVGQACARNPFPIVVPCHRVTGAGGSLGAYSAGDGPATKAWLLNHEAKDRLL